METIGDRIKRIRTSKGLSQGDLATLVESHRTTINSIERNGENVTAKKLEAISRALGCSLTYLITGEEKDPLDISHIFNSNNFNEQSKNFDNMVVYDNPLQHKYEAIMKYLYSIHKTDFIDQVPTIMEHAIKMALKDLEKENILLPESRDNDVIIEWTDSYLEIFIKHLRASVKDCFNNNL